MRLITSLLCSIALAGPALAADLDWPEITSQTKPWSRWWWLGNIGTKEDFSIQMQKYAAAGLGGLEITPIYGVRGEEKRFHDFLSPGFMDLFDHVLAEGKRLNLGIDMSTGTGWPFGGPWVTPDIAARHVVTKSYTVKAGERLAEPVAATDEPLVRVAGPRQVDIKELTDPVSSNANLQDLSLDQVRFPRKVQLQVLMAQSDSGQKLNLTDKVGPDGRLDWTAPAGNWTLYAVFLGWHGKQVERAAPGGEGDVIDHFYSGALAKYLKKFDDALVGHNATGLRAYFNDSYEVDDATGESNWTARFFDEFKKRRGYDLRDELAAFFGKDTDEKNSRVMSDHRETISDLLLEEFTQPWAKWAATHGAVVRNQAHGSPANLLDLYAASGIPETEGSNIAGMKLASSAAHVTGKKLASSETATWLGEHWTATLGDIKQRVDAMFLGGVNHNCYHGTVFSPPGEPWPGFHFYASVELDPSNSIWADAPVLNAYVARCQSFLQAGRPANDILYYYPIYDTWAQRGTGAMPHFGAGGGARGGGGNQSAAQELLTRGYTFDYVSDRLLAGVKFADGALQTGGSRYQVVVVPEVKLMPVETMNRLFALADAGATIVIHKNAPLDVPGLGRLNARRSEFQVHGEALKRATKDADGVSTLAWNKGRILVGDDLGKLLTKAGVAREALVDKGLQFERRAHDSGYVYFLVNRSSAPVDGWVPLRVDARSAVAIFNPMNGESGFARSRNAPAGGVEIYVRLAPGESCVVKTISKPVDGLPYAFWSASGEARPLAGPWSLTFTTGGPQLPAAMQISELRSWTELDGDSYKAFSGTALYAATIRSNDGEPVLIDLGRVADSARVKLNGREIAALIAPPWRVVLDRDRGLKAGENKLEVVVTNVSANRIADLDRRDPSWKKFYNTNYPSGGGGSNRGPDGNFSAAKWTPRASGLLGPVTMATARRVEP